MNSLTPEKLMKLHSAYEKSKNIAIGEDKVVVEIKADINTMQEVFFIFDGMETESGETIQEVIALISDKKIKSDIINEKLTSILSFYKSKLKKIIKLLFDKDNLSWNQEAALFMSIIPLFSIALAVDLYDEKSIALFEKSTASLFRS